MTSKFLGFAGTLLAAVIIAAAAAGPSAQGGVVVMKPAPPGPLPPLPSVNYTPARPMAVVQQVYEFAARHPEVLQYVPCYCGCQREGHQGNHDCFIKSRAANGRVLQWDAHGMGCAICLEVGRRAMMLFNDKKSVAEIRATIDKEYGSRAQTQTPTPRPPQTGKGRNS